METVALSLGTNSGDRWWYMQQMEQMIQKLLDPPVVSSVVMETEPLEVDGVQPWYLNRIVCGGFSGEPHYLLQECQSIESALGRTGKGMRTERTADIDILLFGSRQLKTAALIIPHPSLGKRRFCLEGLKQTMPEMMIASENMNVLNYYKVVIRQLNHQQIRFTEVREEQHGN